MVWLFDRRKAYFYDIILEKIFILRSGMGIGIIGLLIAIIIFVLFLNIVKIGIKILCFVVLALVLGVTIWICSAQPNMHKPFSLETIEYLFKINKDGSVTTTKQITQTVLKDKN